MVRIAGRSSGGSVLLVALIIALVLGFTCASVVIFSAANATSSQQALRRAEALTSAEIGVERAKTAIAQGTYAAQFSSRQHQAVDCGTITASNGIMYGNYSVYVMQNYGNLQEQYLITTQGSTGTSTREVSVIVRRAPAQLPNLLGAITFYNPNGLANFSGQPPYVCGLDTNLPNVPFNTAKASDCTAGSGAGPDAVGVAVHDDGSVASIITALAKNKARIVGTDGSNGSSYPSVYNVSVSNPTHQVDPLQASDVVALANAIADSPDCVYNGSQWVNGSGSPISAGTWGTISAPTIVVIRPPAGTKINLNGNLAGVGVLVIDGEVKFGGTFNYAGLVMITQDGSATVDLDMAGTPLIMGAIVAANAYSSSNSMLDLRGTSDVFFSRQGLSYAAQALTNHSKFQTLFYMEKTPNASDLAIH